MKVGDKVRIIGGPYKASRGTIVADSTGSWDWRVKLQGPEFYGYAPVGYLSHELKLVAENKVTIEDT